MDPGTRLGPYEILEQLGAGGMGEVWLAEDTRLGRKVAIKVLPAEFASDSERLARFEQEARAAAALNHPHIAAVFDVGAEGSTHYMVQEWLQGATLREKLERGALPLKRALQLGAEVAGALAAAHRAGIVHRDLKPENVFVTEDGHAKVLDFGLAKLTEMSAASRDASMSPTVMGTMAGTVMGTAGYMAPEQIEGGEVDGRADLFALGCVLQEMVTGRRAFRGKSLLDTLHRIAHGEPEEPEVAGTSLPGELRRILDKCLSRERELRYQHADDVRVDLQRLASDLDAGRLEAPAPRDAAAAPGIPWGFFAIAVLAILAAFAVGRWTTPAPEAPRLVRYTIRPEPGQSLISFFGRPGLGIDATGERLAYLSASTEFGFMGRITVRRLDGFDATALGTRAFQSLAISPDGRWIVGVSLHADPRAPAGLVRMAMADGSYETLAEGLERRGAVGWLDADRVVFGSQTGLSVINAEGGQARSLPWPQDLAGAFVHDLSPLPGGNRLLVSLWVGAADFDASGLIEGLGDTGGAVFAFDTVSGELKLLLSGGGQARYVEPGFLVFSTESESQALQAVRFDADALRVIGQPQTVIRDVSMMLGGVAEYDVNARGDLVYRQAGKLAGQRELAWVDMEGREEALPIEPGGYGRPRVSSDGRRVAVDDENDGDIWVWDLQRVTRMRLTRDPELDDSPLWSPDDSQIYFWSDREPRGIYRKAASGLGEAEFVATSELKLRPYRFLPDGRGLLVARTNNDILLVSLAGDGVVTPILETGFATSRPELSPDGRWLAYRGNETGEFQIYVRPFPNVEDDRIAITSEGGITPIWSRDGKTLYYMRGGEMYAVDVSPGENFDAGRPRLVFSGPYENLSAGGRRFDMSPDGSRFLLVKDMAQSSGEGDSIRVVLNWRQELERLFPAR